jgi:hypothetical protein
MEQPIADPSTGGSACAGRAPSAPLLLPLNQPYSIGKRAATGAYLAEPKPTGRLRLCVKAYGQTSGVAARRLNLALLGKSDRYA